MKRVISFLLIIPFVIACLVPSVSADEIIDYGNIDLLDLGYFSAFSYDYMISVQGYTVRYWSDYPNFNIEFSDPGIGSIDVFSMLVETDSTDFQIGYESVDISPTPFDNVYLVTGTSLNTDWTSTPDALAIHFDMFDGSYIRFINFFVSSGYISSVGVAGYNLTTQGYIETEPGEYWENEYYIPSGSADESIRFQFTPVAPEGSYEYFDIHLGFEGLYISAINVLQGDKPVSYILTSSYYDSNGTLITKSGNGLNDVLSETVGEFWLSIRVICPDAALIDGIPYIFIDCGTHNGNQSIQYNLSIFPSFVSLGSTAPSGLFQWMNRINTTVDTWFRDLYGMLEENINYLLDSVFINSGGAEMESDTTQQQIRDDFSNVEDQLGQLDKPEVSDDSLNPDIIIPSHDVVMATAPLTAVMSNGTIKDVFMLAMIFIFAGYIIYGKR